MKVDGKALDLMDKLTLKYIGFVSQRASEICNESGKKTLNISHILSAIQNVGFESHIKSLKAELNIDINNENLVLGEDEVEEMKEKINLKKKKKKDKKKKEIEFNDELKNEQLKLFEVSKIEAMNIISQEKNFNDSSTVCNKTIVNDGFIGENEVIEEEDYD